MSQFQFGRIDVAMCKSSLSARATHRDEAEESSGGQTRQPRRKRS